MIQKIHMHEVASYKQPIIVSNLKHINLFYGLNGTGKSTLSNFLSIEDTKETNFSSCQKEFNKGTAQPDIIVYNEGFVEKNFLSIDTQRGVFTLDSANTEAQKNIKEAKSNIEVLEPKIKALDINIEEINRLDEADYNKLKEKVYVAKQDYYNTSLKPCFSGYVAKEAFLARLLESNASDLLVDEIASAISAIEAEYGVLTSNDSKPIDPLPLISLSVQDIEKAPLLMEKIVGSKDSYLSDLIATLDHENWVNEGIKKYLDQIDDCPFCKQEIKPDLKSKLKAHINKVYEEKENKIINLHQTYENEASRFAVLQEKYLKQLCSENLSFSELTEKLKRTLNSNVYQLKRKLTALGDV